VESFDDYVDDGAHVLEQIYRILEAEKKSERIELTLFGHSMGGLISLRTVFLHTELALRAGLRRLITSAPLLGLAFEVPLLKRAVGQLLARTPLGAFQMETGLDVSATSRDPAVVEAYSHDRLVHSKATSKFYFGMLEAIADTRARKDGLWTPVLALLPQADRLVDPKASLKFFEELQTPHKSIKTFPEYYHESFNDLGKDEVFEEIRKWLRGDSKNSAKLS
jgi:alpha-beta hydrolase superfamily lysophospholipase